MTRKLTPSEQLALFIENEEGFKDKAYRNFPEEPWTVGHGLTRINGVPVKEGDTITPEESRKQLRNHLAVTANMMQLKNRIPDNVTQQQFDALLSLAYNTGHDKVLPSDTAREFFEGKDIGHKIPQWKLVEGKPVEGLWQRRLRELDIYNNGNYRMDWTHSPEYAIKYPFRRPKKGPIKTDEFGNQ